MLARVDRGNSTYRLTPVPDDGSSAICERPPHMRTLQFISSRRAPAQQGSYLNHPHVVSRKAERMLPYRNTVQWPARDCEMQDTNEEECPISVSLQAVLDSTGQGNHDRRGSKTIRRNTKTRGRWCANCETMASRQWVRGEGGVWLCHSCGQFWRKNGFSRPQKLWNRPTFKRAPRSRGTTEWSPSLSSEEVNCGNKCPQTLLKKRQRAGDDVESGVSTSIERGLTV